MTVNVNVNAVAPTRMADGNLVYYGTTEDLVDRGQYLNTLAGNVHCAEFNVAYQDVALGTDTTHLFVLSYNVFIPKGAYVEKCEFYTSEVWDSASSDVTLNFGLIKQSDYTIVSATGLMAAIAKSVIDTAGSTIEAVAADSLGSSVTYVGSQVGVIAGQNNLVTCHWTAHVPTAGSGTLKVFYRNALAA